MIIIDRESHHQVFQWSLLLRRQGCTTITIAIAIGVIVAVTVTVIVTVTITITNLPFDLFQMITLLAPIFISNINIALHM